MDWISYLLNASWLFWITLLVVIFFLLWLFFGGGKYEYIGLKPLKVGVDTRRYIDDGSYVDIGIDSDDIPVVNETTIVETPVETPVIVTKPPKPKKKSKKRVSKCEQACRKAIEEIYGKPFPTIRPNFLKNPETKRNLELDCYNAELKIAVEMNGEQHYKWPNWTGMSRENFIKQVRRDQYKIKTCDLNGIYLITVPYTIPNNKIKDYIIYHLPENAQQRLEDEQLDCEESDSY